jgi:hypothetical protein
MLLQNQVNISKVLSEFEALLQVDRNFRELEGRTKAHFYLVLKQQKIDYPKYAFIHKETNHAGRRMFKMIRNKFFNDEFIKIKINN